MFGPTFFNESWDHVYSSTIKFTSNNAAMRAVKIYKIFEQI